MFLIQMIGLKQHYNWKIELCDFKWRICTSYLILYSTVDVFNVSLIPSDNPLTIREGTQKNVRCIVNSNAAPAPTITWYLGSPDITSRAGTNASSITLIGNRTDNGKTLECRASNDNKPLKTARTTLNVECKYSFEKKMQSLVHESVPIGQK